MLHSAMIATRSGLAAENGLVTGGHALEAEAGVTVLQRGGNAIDAIVAAAFVGFVVEPAACGLGGYGRLAVWLAERQEFVTIDHYIRAPATARPDMFRIDPTKPLKYYGFPHTVGMQAERGHLAPAVPGAVAGLHAAHAMLGRLPWASLLEPAIAAAEAGVPFTWDMVLAIANRLEDIRAVPGAADVLLPDGRMPRIAGQVAAADRIDTRDLAATLKEIAQHGAAGFHGGRVAAAIERECLRHGGVLTAADLAAYRPRILRETPARYRDCAYVTAYDQVGYEALNILDRFDLARLGPDSAAYRHLMAEALALAFTDNMTHYGDPDCTSSPVNGLASRSFAAERAAAISLDRAVPRPVTPGNPWPHEATGPAPAAIRSERSAGGISGTSQMAAADRDGNLATLITSVTSAFGSLVRVPGTGIFLNNAMQNFDPRPERANSIQPGKMPIFAVPSLVATRGGKALFGGCGSGGYRITTGVLHALVHALDFGMGIQAAVDAPRVHCQGDETFVDARIPASVRDRLAALGHRIVVQEETPNGGLYGNFGRVNAIYVDPKTGLKHAGTGPAWGTAAAGY